MTQCSTEKFYFNDSYSQSLMISIGKILRNNKTKTTQELYDLIKDYLKNQKDFSFGEESNGKRYKESINLLSEKINNIIDKLMITFKLESKIQEFKEIMRQNFLADSGIKHDTSTTIEEVENPVMENNPDMPNESERVKLKMSKIVKDYYGTVQRANNFRKAEFSRELTELTIIDTKNRKLSRNTEDLNKNIILLKNKYFRNIINYLKSIDSNFSYTSDLFGENGNVINGYRQVYNKFYNEIKKLKENKTIENKITEGWKRRLFGEQDLFYDAFNSYINLVYFDTVLEDAIGNVIEIANPAFKDDEWDFSYMKYKFSKGDEHKRKGFQNSENRDALKDIAKFSKVILSTIPIYSTSDGKFLNRYVNIGNFANAITSLFTNIYKLGDKYTNLQEAIINFHDNPSYYSGIIFKEISNKDNNIQIALRSIGVNPFNLNILTSVFKHVYDESNSNSIKSIEIDSMKKQFSINGYSIVDCINGVIDRTMDATYLQIGYSTGSSNNIEVTEKPKYLNRKEQYDTINRINAFNFLEGRTAKQRSKLSRKYFVTREKGNTTYSVKFGDIKITGESSSANGILDPKPIKFKFSNSKIKEIFNPEYAGIDLISKDSINKIIDGVNLTQEEQIFRDVLEFIDSFLETRILTPAGMDLLFNYKQYTSDSENYISDLLQTAFRAAIINNINYQFDEALANKKCKSILDYESFIKQVYSPFEEILKHKKNDFVINNSIIPNIITVRSSENWIDQWITVKKIVSGEVSKSTTKDVHGNAVANNRTSFLGGNINYYLSKYRKVEDYYSSEYRKMVESSILNEIGDFEGTTLLSELIDDDLNINWELFDKLQTEFFKDLSENLNNRKEYHDGEQFTIDHIKNVVESAKKLSINDKISRRNLVLSALLHDIAKPYHNDDHGLDAMQVINKIFKGSAPDNLLKLAIRYHMLQANDPIQNYYEMLLAAESIRVDKDEFIELVLALNTADIQRNRPDDAIDLYSGKTILETIQEENRIKRNKFEEAKKILNRGVTATNPLLFTNNSNLIVKTIFNTDAKYRNGIKKSTKDMCASELFYSSIIFNFYGNYLQDSINESKFQQSKNNLFKSFLVQPTTFSDKISFVTYAIKGNKALDAPGKSYNGKTIYELDTDQTIDLYQDTIGEAYVNLYNNVLDDLRNVLDMPNASFEEINNKLHTISQEELLTLADKKNIELQLDTHYRKFGNVCKFNELLYHYANDLYIDKKALIKRFEFEKVNFVNDLINSGVSFYTNYYNDSDRTISTGSSSNMVSKIINLLYSNPTDKNKYKNDWIKNNKLIIAKVTDKEGNTRNVTGGQEIPLDSTVELNPLLEKYFYTDSLLSNNLRFELTGSEVAHPDKAKINFTKELNNIRISPQTNSEYFKQIKSIPIINVKNRSDLFNIKALQSNEIEYDIIEEPWKIEDDQGNMIDHPTKKKTVLKIYIKGKRQLGSFDLVADTNYENTEYNGEYSVHFKTGDADTKEMYGSTSEERSLLYKYLISAIPIGAKVSTYGKVSEGGKKALEKVGKNMYIVGTRNVKDRSGNNLVINIFQKTEAIDNFKDLIWLRNESKLNSKLKPVYDKAILKIEAFAQGTQLKRNVIIPATLQYEQQNTLNGIPQKIKVAVIEDTQANIFNFRGDNTTEDAHDGSAYISPLISILENKALQDQEVGVDKKPIWHSFNARLMSATLLKFATFTQTAERMRTSLKSDISLYKLFKQMHDLAWADLNPDGTVSKWNNSRGVEIDLINTKGFKKGRKTINFLADIIGDESLYYEEDNQSYQITDFGRDEKGYYTIEHKANFLGSRSSNDMKIYHRFDKNGNHFKFIEGVHEIPSITSEFHDINSLFQLYNVLGGIYAQSLIEDENGIKKLSYSDAASYATVNFMNNVSVRIGNDTSDISQRTYYQPLKEMLIGYAANKSAVKNGISNLNHVDAWKGGMKLRYMTLDSDGLGIQMDADHEIDESEMTEFSQVISALEAGGRLHGEAKEVYKTLGQLAVQASKFEIDTASAYIYATISKSKKYNGITLEDIRSELYDIFARTIINNYKVKEDRIDIATPIIEKIKETFNLNENHKLDEFKLPNSDNSLYSQIIPTFISNINSKSIKRKYPGSGCVMVPGFGIIQNYKYNGKIKQFDDVLKEARQFNQKNNIFHKFDSSKETIAKYNHNLVETYLKFLQESEWVKATESIEQFIPTDKVDVLKDGNYLCTIELDKISDYYSFQGFSIQNPDGDPATRDIIRRGFISKVSGVDVNSANLTFAMNITKPRDLAPARIRWKYKDTQGIEHIENIFNTKPVRDSFMRKGDKTFNLKDNRKLVQEIFDKLDSGTYLGYNIYDLENEAAELVISNMYATKFKSKGLSLSEILEKGEDHFKIASIPVIHSTHYDMVFTTNSGNYKYISFKTPKEDKENIFRPKNVGWKYVKPIGKDLYATTKDGQKLFKIGTYVIRKDLTVFGDKFQDSKGNNIENPNLRVNSKGQVLEYKEFISHYKVSEVLNKNKSGGHVKQYDLYVINTKNIQDGLVNWTEETVNAQISKILSDLYRSSDFNSIRLNNTLLSGSATKIAKVLPTLNVSDDLKRFLTETTQKYLSNIDETKPVHTIDKNYNKDLKDYYNKVKSSLYSSFLKSLTFTASRIPAQTLQSFMQMKVTAFTQSSKNIAYVSHWQTWLQGSDY